MFVGTIAFARKFLKLTSLIAIFLWRYPAVILISEDRVGRNQRQRNKKPNTYKRYIIIIITTLLLFLLCINRIICMLLINVVGVMRTRKQI